MGVAADTLADLQLVGNMSDATLRTNVAEFLKIVNKFKAGKHIDYKLPVGEDTSPRAALANTLESAEQTDTERQKPADQQARRSAP